MEKNIDKNIDKKSAMVALQMKEVFTLLTQEYSIILATSDTHFKEVEKVRADAYFGRYAIEDEETKKSVPSDEYDAQSFIYLLRHNPSGSYMGTVRIVFANGITPSKYLPLEKMEGIGDISSYTRAKPIGEVSRLALCRELPKYKNFSALRLRSYLSMGLMSTIGINSFLYKYDSLFTLMESSLDRLLNRQGVAFRAIGESIELYGKRTPYTIKRDDLIQESKSILAQLSYYYTKELSEQPNAFNAYVDNHPYLNREDIQLDNLTKALEECSNEAELREFLKKDLLGEEAVK